MNIFELSFNQVRNELKQKIIPIEISKNNSIRLVDEMFYKNHYTLIKNLQIILDKHDSKSKCRRCFDCYTSQYVLIKRNQICEQQEITASKTSNESHLCRKIHFHRSLLYLRTCADFKADNEIDNSCRGRKTNNIYKQSPVFNGYYIVSELNDVLQRGFS